MILLLFNFYLKENGYIGKKLNEKLAAHDVDLVTTVRKNIKP